MGATGAERGRFVWHELMTTDVEGAKAFYGAVVGWGTTRRQGAAPTTPPEYEMWTAGEQPVGGVMTLPPEAEKAGAPAHWIAYTEVPDVDATVVQALGMGSGALVAPEEVPGVGRFAALQDPQGAVFAVITSAMSYGPEADADLGRFSWHELYADDLDGAIRFYEALFGWAKQGESDLGPMGIYHIFGRGRFQYGGMMRKPSTMDAPPHWLHYVRVDDADAAVERAKRAGGKVLNGPMDVPGGDRIAQLLDPQGAAFAVHAKGG